MNNKKQQKMTPLEYWQFKLLPFMVVMLVVLTIFFLGASLFQVFQMKESIERVPEINLESEFKELEKLNKDYSKQDLFKYIRWKSLAKLEAYSINRRYQQATQILMTRVWIIYLGFVTGMILALVGAAFILGKLRESETKMEAESSLWKFSIASASPGLVLASLGTILMVTTILARSDIKVTDSALYISDDNRELIEAIKRKNNIQQAPLSWPEQKNKKSDAEKSSGKLDLLEKKVDQYLGSDTNKEK